MIKKYIEEIVEPWKDVSLTETQLDELWGRILKPSFKPRRRIKSVHYIAATAGFLIAISVFGAALSRHNNNTTAIIDTSYPTTPDGVVKSWLQALEKGKLLQAATYVYDEFHPTQQLELQHYEHWKDQRTTNFTILSVQYDDSTHAVVDTSVTINSVNTQIYHFNLQKMSGRWKVAFLESTTTPMTGNSVTAAPGLGNPVESPPVTQIMPEN